jgi:signal transduction histidine kinase
MPLTKCVQYTPKGRTERLIAGARLILGVFFLMAIYLDPTEPSRYAGLTYGILASYLFYSLVLMVCVWYLDVTHRLMGVAAHFIDLAVFAGLMFLTEGPNSPFFVYFIFVLVCSALRWQWVGTLCTAAAALAIVSLMAWDPTNFYKDENFELNRFIMRMVYLAVVAALLGYLGAHEARLRKVFSMLAAWRPSVPDERPGLAREILERSAGILGVSRAILFWEEEDEPWVNLATWSSGEFSYSRENPGTYGHLLDGPMAYGIFFCRNLDDPNPMIVRNSDDCLRRWDMSATERRLIARFEMKSVLSMGMKGEKITGSLLALDKPRMTVDDLVLGDIVAQQVAARLGHLNLNEQLRQAAASEERIRLARDLHDGTLQTLTGAALQLETAQRMMEADPGKARLVIKEIQRVLAKEQKDLRGQIRLLKPAVAGRGREKFALADRLGELSEQIRLQWEIPVKIGIKPSAAAVDGGMARDVYFVIHESLINAAKHACATDLRADLFCDTGQVRITVADNGRGFPFRGYYDHETLFEMKRGPVTLKERIAALGGTLSIDSSENGARLEISLPLAPNGG